MKATLELSDVEYTGRDGEIVAGDLEVEVTYDLVAGYPATYWEPAAADEVDILAVKVVASSPAAECNWELARYIQATLGEYLESLVAKQLADDDAAFRERE